MLMALYEHYEKSWLAVGKVPLSKHPNREVMEQRLLATFMQGKNASLVQLQDPNFNPNTHICSSKGGHGDHWDDGSSQQQKDKNGHGDDHGDRPHGDHNDDKI